MWVTCHECNGQGYIVKGFKISTKNSNKKNYSNLKKPCPTCVPRGTFLDIIMRGQLWVEDNYDPITPPNSP